MSESPSPDKPEVKERGILDDLTKDVLSLESGLPVTIWHMLKSPGLVIDSYFNDRGRYINPFRYAIIILALVMLVGTFLVNYEALYQNALETGAGEDLDSMIESLSAQVPQFDWQKYFDSFIELSVIFTERFAQISTILLFAPIMALFSWLFFKSKKPKYVHHYVMMIYQLATYAFFSILLLPFLDESTVLHTSFYGIAVFSCMFGFMYYVIYRFIGLEKVSDHFKAIFTFIFGYFSYSIITAIMLYSGALIYMRF